MDDEQVEAGWEIQEFHVTSIKESLRNGEDDIVRYYACKTIENITAQSIAAGEKFAQKEVVELLLTIYHQEINEAFGVVSSVALSHLSKLNPNLFPVIFESVTPTKFLGTFFEGHARTQQAFITMLNLALRMPYQKLVDTLIQEKNFLEALMNLCMSENSSTIIKGKTVLTFILLFKLDFRWMALAHNEHKFFQVLDRI